ncbi:MAG: kynureninase [Armatimonadetes bacterium]|nr:kynureninase [Armatimonadota bacterium]
MTFSYWAHEANIRDLADPLAAFRDRFYRKSGEIYLDGNSLGLLSTNAEACVLRVLNEWKTLGIGGWTDAGKPWYTLSESLSESLAPLVGADTDEVIITGSTTANLHQLLATLYEPGAGREAILMDALSFPSDIFAAQSFLRGRGLDSATHLHRVQSRNGRTVETGDIIAALETGAYCLAVLPSVIYMSGQLLDMARITEAARANGTIIGWDLSHSVGTIPHDLSGIGADFAFWCSYKYLNAGPGAVGGLYLNRRHFDKSVGLAGWWGSHKETQFAMTHNFAPATGAGALQVGTPHLLSLAPLEGALRITHEAGIHAIRAKSLALTAFLRDTLAARFGFDFATPESDDQRGGHLAVIHPDAARISRALRRAQVMPDFRPPDILRLAPVALYTSFGDCVEAMARLSTILETRSYLSDEGSELVP